MIKFNPQVILDSRSGVSRWTKNTLGGISTAIILIVALTYVDKTFVAPTYQLSVMDLIAYGAIAWVVIAWYGKSN